MDKLLRVLLVEDSEDDASLLLLELSEGGYDCTSERVETAEAMTAALGKQAWDVVISDMVLPRFSGLAALALLRKTGKDIPFILVSGKIDEEVAVASLKAGAHDFVTKLKLARLVPAIEREMGEAEVRRQRREAEKALRETEERLRILFDNSSDSMTVVDAASGRILQANRAFERLTGRSLSELPNLTIRDIAPEGVNEKFKLALRATGSVDIGERNYVWRDGSQKTALVTLVPLGNNLVFGVARDISERKQAEKELRDRERRLAALHEVSQAVSESVDLVAVSSQALKSALGALDLDAGVLRSLDESCQELLVLATWALSPEVEAALYRKAIPVGQGIIGKVARAGQPTAVADLKPNDLLYPSVLTPGFRTFVGVPLRNGARVVGTMSGFSLQRRPFSEADMRMLQDLGDILGLALARAELFRKVEAKGREWEETFDSMSDGVAILDGKRAMVRANRALARMLGTTPAKLVGQHCCQVIHGSDKPIPQCPFDACLSQQESCFVVRQEPHLGNRWLHLVVNPMKNAVGGVGVIVEVVRDVTALKQAEMEVERRTAELAELNRREQLLRQNIEQKNAELDKRVQELSALNSLFKKHLDMRFQSEEALNLVLQELGKMAGDATALLNRARLIADPKDHAEGGGGALSS